MKNKFKKSKIIVPALALITATTVASVTGTVAWFTASRAVIVTGSQFVATKLESKLNVTLTMGVGTSVDTTDTSKITMATNDKLTHGSYDAKAITNTSEGNLYVAKINDNGQTVESYTDLGTESNALKTTATTTENSWIARSDATNGNIYYGVSWTMTFSLETETTNQTDYLLFDVDGSSFTDKSGKTTTTANGFRIAFMTDKKCLVIGGDSEKKHVNGTGSSSTANFEEANYEAITATTAKASDITKSSDNDTLANNKLCLGTIGTATANSLVVKCVAWYEGEDTYVKDKHNGTTIDMSKIEASLNFYTRYKVTDGTTGG